MTDATLIWAIIPLIFASILAFWFHLLPTKKPVSITVFSSLLSFNSTGSVCLVGTQSGESPCWRLSSTGILWIPSLNISFTLYFDHLSALFSLLITGIGGLVILYSGFYFKGDDTAGRFLVYIFLFMAAMQGLVISGDLITLFIFWEGTSFVSFLLIAYKYKDAAARNGAFKALLITGGGGIALLGGLLLLADIAGTTDLRTILNSGTLIRDNPYYLAPLVLIGFASLTKSAQFPAHIWLPDAMAAPTPASAYLHSATMVKAGIFFIGPTASSNGKYRGLVLDIQHYGPL